MGDYFEQSRAAVKLAATRLFSCAPQETHRAVIMDREAHPCAFSRQEARFHEEFLIFARIVNLPICRQTIGSTAIRSRVFRRGKQININNSGGESRLCRAFGRCSRQSRDTLLACEASIFDSPLV